MTTQLDLLKRTWLDDVEPAICRSIPSGDVFTCDRLHQVVPCEPQHVNWWGVLLARMKRKGMIAKLGWVASERIEANGRPVALWRMI